MPDPDQMLPMPFFTGITLERITVLGTTGYVLAEICHTSATRMQASALQLDVAELISADLHANPEAEKLRGKDGERRLRLNLVINVDLVGVDPDELK